VQRMEQTEDLKNSQIGSRSSVPYNIERFIEITKKQQEIILDYEQHISHNQMNKFNAGEP
jgi:hypothetical protein